MKILIAPSGLKESVEPLEAVRLMSAGVRKVYPEAQIVGIPVVDGGEGTTKTLVELTNGKLIETTVLGPVGVKVPSFIGILGSTSGQGTNTKTGSKTAVIEMAAAAGLRLVPRDQRDPQLTTTYGVGELIKLALEQPGVDRILVGCGDSGTNDAGVGMAQALGVKFLDKDGQDLGLGGIHLPKLARIDMSGLHPKIASGSVRIDAALNWNNILCGPKGVAVVYGPQKGATPAQVKEMGAALDLFAHVVKHDVGKDVAFINGGGASGGLGAGLFAFLSAHLHARFDVIMEYLGLEVALRQADLILTAEGAIDFQTPQGKVPSLLAERAVQRGIPVVVLAGMIGSGAEDNYIVGVTAFESIQTRPVTLSFAIENGGLLLEQSAERAMRFIKAGTMIASKSKERVLSSRSLVSDDESEDSREDAILDVDYDSSELDQESVQQTQGLLMSKMVSNTILEEWVHFGELVLGCFWLLVALLYKNANMNLMVAAMITSVALLHVLASLLVRRAKVHSTPYAKKMHSKELVRP
jgi:glycerate 2-kinase